ncbi:MAG: hypothetical protein GFH27_549415n53 [Chloroflexi bacterium AL-W]|nr:hypothetical protein [Chloroflexi bacterium AL-N1]NOK71501.1 hypothetical protein [Chloroflexi bacterium AL-N10]NOK77282.1 hypothetical protein [Chloroflexi bacterium AL-N5]NOK86322.1 hypothetical protein [Chloroflexi bacterium AL-W]NOK93292.1 hypothetical protein [Chloroflexi bacterium AL-N15]
MWGWIKRLVYDDSGNAYVQYTLLAPMLAIVVMGVYQSLYGPAGDRFKATIQDMAFVYADGFENGVNAPGPYWGEVPPNVHDPSKQPIEVHEQTTHDIHTSDINRQDVHVETIRTSEIKIEPSSLTPSIVSIPALIRPSIR